MRVLLSSALALGLCLTPMAVQAQQGAYGSPALLPVPATTVPYGAYTPAPAVPGGYRTAYVPQGSRIVPTSSMQPTPAPPAPPPAVPIEPEAPAPTPDGVYTPGGYETALNGCGNGCCANNPCCGYGMNGPGWFGSFGALIMSRTKPNATWFSAESNNPDNQVMNGRNATGDWSGGWQGTLGYTNCCGYSMSATYWGLSPLTDFASVSGTFFNTPLNVNILPDLNNQTVSSYFDGSPEHRLWRKDQINSAEVNGWLPNAYGNGVASLRVLGGFRYFQFNDRLTFGSVAGPGVQTNADSTVSTGVFGDNGGQNEAYYRVSDNNNMFGGQIGMMGRVQVLPRVGLFVMPKIGLLNNHTTQRQLLYTGNGVESFNLGASNNTLSFLAEIDAGLNWYLNQSWYIYGGYRAVAITGVALSDNQVPFYLNDFPAMSRVNYNGSLIVHGAMLGLGCNF